MKKAGSAQWVPAVLGPSLGLPFGGAVPAVRLPNRVVDTPTPVEPEASNTRIPVASATRVAVCRETEYRVVAWQPLGRPAFVFMIAVGERRFLQPAIPEGADFDAVMQNAADFVARLLDGDVPGLDVEPW